MRIRMDGGGYDYSAVTSAAVVMKKPCGAIVSTQARILLQAADYVLVAWDPRPEDFDVAGEYRAAIDLISPNGKCGSHHWTVNSPPIPK